MDNEGKEFFHFDHFCQHYRTQIMDLNRTLDSLMRGGLLPPTYQITTPGNSLYVSKSFLSTVEHRDPDTRNPDYAEIRTRF